MMLFRSLVLAAISVTVAFAQNPDEPFHQSVRNNDLPALRALIRQHGVSGPDSRGHSPLMLAAALGSYDAMKLLIDAGADVKAVSAAGLTALHLGAGDIKKVRLLIDSGADVNVRSQMGRTPLIIAAFTNGASETVKLLLSKGADINAADATGVTPLIAAATANDTATAKLLIAGGAKVDAQANIAQSATALMAAAHNGNAELTRLLLERKAPVHAVSSAGSGVVKNGVVQFGSATALHMAALSSQADVVKLLIDAGARIDGQDMRGMTPLMWSISTDRPDISIIRMLLQKGADPLLRSKAGENAQDWAKKFNHPAVMAELKLDAVQPRASGVPAVSAGISPRAAVERSMPLLQKSAVRMLDDGGCIACHAQPVTQMAVTLARNRGWNVGGSFPAESLETLKRRWMNADQPLLQGQQGGGQPDTLLYSSLALAAAGELPSWNTDVLVHFLTAKQRSEGYWHGVGASRAPIQDGDFSRTAMAIRVLAVYAMPARKAEMTERIQRAAKWLAAQTPLSTEDRTMQILGLKWAGAAARPRETRTRELLAQQRMDGGWSQTPYLESDAYATGQVLYTLHEAGIPSTDPAFQRGVEYLTRTQREDGSWYVQSRAMKIQPYFESGFPYSHDQWISSAATAWAAMGLSLAAPESSAAAAAPPLVR